MSDFAIPHIFIAGKPDGNAVRLESRIQGRADKAVEVGRVGKKNSIRVIAGPDADAIHDD
jgi:hypothetical protein